jgi:hypothetical protein
MAVFEKTYDSIINGFTKIQRDLDTFVASNRAKAEKHREEQRLAQVNAAQADANADRAEKTLKNLSNLIA